MPALSTVRTAFARARDAVLPPRSVFAHCDIPCGIYDPHEAQIAALTVLRMDQLIAEAVRPPTEAKPEEQSAYIAKLARYSAVKESHAERVKHEVRVIWGDYVTADHLKQHPVLGELVFKIFKQASKARQSTALTDAQELLSLVQQFAETFWLTKGAKTRRQPSLQRSGGDIVVPVPA